MHNRRVARGRRLRVCGRVRGRGGPCRGSREFRLDRPDQGFGRRSRREAVRRRSVASQHGRPRTQVFLESRGVARRLAGGHAHNRAFDHDVVRPPDHDQMLDIVAPHENKLAISVEVEGVDHAQSGLASALAPKSQPRSRQNTVENIENKAAGDSAAHIDENLHHFLIRQPSQNAIHANLCPEALGRKLSDTLRNPIRQGE